MKRHSWVLLAVSALLSSPFTLAAEGQIYIAPGLQWMDFDNDTGFDNELGYFVGLGLDITDRISAEISTFDLDPIDAMGENVDIDHYKIDGFYHFDTDWGGLQPFLVTGFGNTHFFGENDSLWDFGGGIRYRFSDNLYWRTALRGFTFQDRDDFDVGIDSALVYYFGGRSSSPAPARRAETPQAPSTTRSDPAPRSEPAQRSRPETPIADADRDGVADSRDRCPDTPRNYAVDENGCPIPVEEIAQVELLVNFDFDRSEVKPEYFDEIEEVAEFMEQYEDVVVELEGHTDGRGTEEYNQGLSERRANAVRQVMIDRFGVSAGRITARGFGESQPVASNNTDAGRAQNRRVITVIIKTLQNYQPR